MYLNVCGISNRLYNYVLYILVITVYAYDIKKHTITLIHFMNDYFQAEEMHIMYQSPGYS